MRRALFPALLLLALAAAACERQGAPVLIDSRTPPSLAPRFWAPPGWAWGAIEVPGAPAARYGVGVSHRPTRAHVILMTGYGESAETYFETARALLAKDYAVWILEPIGQGGSARAAGAGDVGRAAPPGADAAALRRLVEDVIRPANSDTVVIAAGKDAASAALQGLSTLPRRLDGAVLWSPNLTARAGPVSSGLTRVGLGAIRAEGGGWSRPERELTSRAALTDAWALANPDLRMGGPSHGWLAAHDREADAATAPQTLARIRAPVLMLASERAALDACRAIPVCEHRPFTDKAPHLAPDVRRQPWLDALSAFIEARAASAASG